MLSYRKSCDNRALFFYFISLLLFLVLVVEVYHSYDGYYRNKHWHDNCSHIILLPFWVVANFATVAISFNSSCELPTPKGMSFGENSPLFFPASFCHCFLGHEVVHPQEGSPQAWLSHAPWVGLSSQNPLCCKQHWSPGHGVYHIPDKSSFARLVSIYKIFTFTILFWDSLIHALILNFIISFMLLFLVLVVEINHTHNCYDCNKSWNYDCAHTNPPFYLCF